MNVNDTLIPQGPQDHLKVLGSRLVSNTTWPCPGGRAARILAASSPMEPIMTSATQNGLWERPYAMKHRGGVQLIGFHICGNHQTKTR